MTAIDVAKRSFTAFGEDKAMRLASSIAFATIFSIAPLFVILIAVLGAVAGGHAHARDELLSVVRASAGSAAAVTVGQIVEATFAKPRQGLIAQIIAWAVFIIGASNLFAALQDGLNSIWHIEATKGGWQQMVRDRLASSGMLLIVALIGLLSFAGNVGVTYVTSRIFGSSSGGSIALSAGATVLTFLVASVIFGLIFKILPDIDISFRHAWFGGLVTAALFVAGQFLIGVYFTKGGVTSTYGAAGSLLVALLWIYYSIAIVLFGAEITKVTAGEAKLSAPSAVRKNEVLPAGTDPRTGAETA